MRKQEKSPNDLDIYLEKKRNHFDPFSPSYTPRAQGFKPGYDRQFKLWFAGQPFKYYGVTTRRYFPKHLRAIFGIGRQTLYDWMEYQLIPPPFLMEMHQGCLTKTWIYAQIKSLYHYHLVFKSRGYKNLPAAMNERELKLLHRDRLRDMNKFNAIMGVIEKSPYEQEWGKYGVKSIE